MQRPFGSTTWLFHTYRERQGRHVIRLPLSKCRGQPETLKTSVPETAPVLYFRSLSLSLSLSLFLSPSRMMRCASSRIDGLQLAGRASAAIR